MRPSRTTCPPGRRRGAPGSCCAELWQLDATGSGVSYLVWLRPDGTPVGSARFVEDGSGAAIDDLYLVRGDHLLSVHSAGDYELRLTSRGPIAPGSEQEPNADASQ